VPDPTPPLALFVVAVVVALVAVELKQRWLLIGAKPVATLALIPVALGGTDSLTTSLVTIGLVLSAAGDTALLGKHRSAFMIGLGAFLVAHLFYAGAFLVAGMGPAWSPLVGVFVFGCASGWLVRRMWSGLLPGLRVPLVLYTGVCTAMAATALSTLTGPWPDGAAYAAAGGALLFFLSDANLAWNDFVEPYRHGQTVTLSLYWTGQLGIALAARWAAHG
jgi:alkenylglycerophosphocholine/alkenylglycerophosphoethanolamine hydrolase